MKRIIVISGKAEAGKSTIAEIINNELSNSGKVVRMAFASTIKNYAKLYFGWNGKEATKPRELLQKLGTDIIRNKLNKYDFHVNRIKEDLEILEDEFDYAIIDDCRFPNEYDVLVDRFGDKVVKIRIERPNHVSKLSKEQLQHKSETALDDYEGLNYLIQNVFDSKSKLESWVIEYVCKEIS